MTNIDDDPKTMSCQQYQSPSLTAEAHRAWFRPNHDSTVNNVPNPSDQSDTPLLMMVSVPNLFITIAPSFILLMVTTCKSTRLNSETVLLWAQPTHWNDFNEKSGTNILRESLSENNLEFDEISKMILKSAAVKINRIERVFECFG